MGDVRGGKRGGPLRPQPETPVPGEDRVEDGKSLLDTAPLRRTGPPHNAEGPGRTRISDDKIPPAAIAIFLGLERLHEGEQFGCTGTAVAGTPPGARTDLAAIVGDRHRGQTTDPGGLITERRADDNRPIVTRPEMGRDGACPAKRCGWVTAGGTVRA